MTSPIDDSDNTTPTEEIYLELQDLTALAEEREESSAQGAPPSSSRNDDEPDNIRSRIARLRALLRDRGALDDT
jgi:hypothetical protein